MKRKLIKLTLLLITIVVLLLVWQKYSTRGVLADLGIQKSYLDMDVDIADALQVFDDTCMLGTVYKVRPEGMEDKFLKAGLTIRQGKFFKKPSFPMNAYEFERPDKDGFECFVNFTSFEDIDEIIRPTFAKFTDTRMSQPMMENQEAFKFERVPLPDGIQSSEPEQPDRADIRSFADTSGIQYFVILRPDAHNLSHKLQLITMPISKIPQ